jgi:hypothetical protein
VYFRAACKNPLQSRCECTKLWEITETKRQQKQKTKKKPKMYKQCFVLLFHMCISLYCSSLIHHKITKLFAFALMFFFKNPIKSKIKSLYLKKKQTIIFSFFFSLSLSYFGFLGACSPFSLELAAISDNISMGKSMQATVIAFRDASNPPSCCVKRRVTTS